MKIWMYNLNAVSRVLRTWVVTTDVVTTGEVDTDGAIKDGTNNDGITKGETKEDKATTVGRIDKAVIFNEKSSKIFWA